MDGSDAGAHARPDPLVAPRSQGSAPPDPRGLLAGLHGSAPRQSRRTTAHEFVRESLRHAILAGKLPLGVSLTQSQIAEALGVSTTPVREALRDLAADGLMDIDTYRTTSVHRPTVAELNEVYDLRRLLETYAIEKIVEHASDDILDRAAGLQDRMDKETDPAEWLLLNAEFHAVLTSAGDSPRLSSFLETLRGSVAMYVGVAIRAHPERRDESNVEHREILEACRARDLTRAIEVTERHMDPTKTAVEAAIAER
jgi:DNA-binding GntR family transcriptional regulator